MFHNSGLSAWWASLLLSPTRGLNVSILAIFFHQLGELQSSVSFARTLESFAYTLGHGEAWAGESVCAEEASVQ